MLQYQITVDFTDNFSGHLSLWYIYYFTEDCSQRL